MELHISRVLSLNFMDRDEVEVDKKANKDRTSLVNKGYGQKEKFFLQDKRVKSRAGRMGPSSPLW